MPKLTTKRNMNYIQPDFSPPIQYNYISEESDYYAIWEKQRGNQFWSDAGFFKIINPGIRNHYSGPDFLQAVIQYPDGNIKHGDVEIHHSTSDWYSHGHHLDKHYEKVVLHVIIYGQTVPVFVGQSLRIPTIKMGVGTLEFDSRPCHNLSESLSKDHFLNWIHIFATQRWQYLQTYFNQGNEHRIRRILAFMDIKSNPHLVQKTIEYYIGIHPDTEEHLKCEMVIAYARNMPWKMGRKRPLSHPISRLPLLIFMAQNYKKILKEVSPISLPHLKNYLLDNRHYHIPTLGDDFLYEILGNILYPLNEIYSEKSQYLKWFNLAVQPYGKYKSHLDKMGYKGKINFGIQQGLIELNKQYCGIDLCEKCPLIKFENRV